MQAIPLDYQSPLPLARTLYQKGEDFVLLHSSLVNNLNAQYSYLAYSPKDEIISENFKEIEEKLTHNKDRFSNNWFGFLGYGLKNCLENLSSDELSFITLPNLWLVNFSNVIVFDHVNQTTKFFSDSNNHYIPKATIDPQVLNIEVENLTSNMNKQEYLNKVETILDLISAGDLYQANLTRKFYGNFKNKVDRFEIFNQLCQISPAPYSCFLKLKDNHIISSSPEQFLSIDEEGNITTRPIKGSARRFKDKKLDLESFNNLKNSTKDQSENLMIVDLMRNDLSHFAEKSSVIVESMFNIDSYETIYQMSSTIKAKKLKDIPSLDIVKACFPPGSMTGAPKIKAMELCSQLEKQARGVYSGAIGFFGGDGTCELSVVIRTLIVKGNKFEFQVGGGIVADSDPILEWEETLTKAKAIAQLLNLQIEKDLLF